MLFSRVVTLNSVGVYSKNVPYASASVGWISTSCRDLRYLLVPSLTTSGVFASISAHAATITSIEHDKGAFSTPVLLDLRGAF